MEPDNGLRDDSGPVLIVFVGLQKYIIGGLTSGAVKE